MDNYCFQAGLSEKFPHDLLTKVNGMFFTQWNSSHMGLVDDGKFLAIDGNLPCTHRAPVDSYTRPALGKHK